jgi:sulfite reductase (ferredoxin)
MVLKAYDIPDTLGAEIDELESLIAAFRRNTVTETELKAHRVPFGIYEQRAKGTYMVRVRCTAGIITPSQLKRVAELSLQFASGTLHATTRQEIQVHEVVIDDLIPVIRELAKVGLSTRGGGGNTVRNITAPWDSGVSQGENFDVSPYAVALTSAMIARHDSWLLPRKYKIAFSGSEKNALFATVNDLGLIAQIHDGTPGFRVFVAGGMGRLSQPGNLLHDFVPASEIFLIAEAIKRLFSKHGNRKNKHAARLRFLWNSLGRERFIAFYEEEKACLRGEGVENLVARDIINQASQPATVRPMVETSAEFETWKKRHVGNQKQSGAHTVRIPLLFGIIGAEKARDLADSLVPFGDNTIRFTHDQNLGLRNIPSEYLGNVYAAARKTSELSNSATLFGNAVACAGASTCQLGICRSRGALQAVIDRLKSSSVDLEKLTDLRIHISGCSNTCGQHMIADLGFFGKVGRKGQHSFPAYSIVAGAALDTVGNARLAEKVDEINARDLPAFAEEILGHYDARKSSYAGFLAYLNAEGRDAIRKSCNRFREVPSFEIDRNYYRDWGDAEIFSLAGKGTGECSAGLFDLIEIDLARLRQIRSAVSGKSNDNSTDKALYDLALISARMLLITRGAEAATEAEVFDLFAKLFIGKKLITARFLPLVEKARAKEPDGLVPLQSEVTALADAVEKLYLGMDNSLQFNTSGGEVAKSPEAVTKADLVRDFRGVACPMNFVKTKMALAGLKSGQILEIALDNGEPVENVPRSVAEEGHMIISTDRIENYWRVMIRKH